MFIAYGGFSKADRLLASEGPSKGADRFVLAQA